MSQPEAALSPLPFELILDDGEPLESDWHSVAFPLLRTLIIRAMVFGTAEYFMYEPDTPEEREQAERLRADELARLRTLLEERR